MWKFAAGVTTGAFLSASLIALVLYSPFPFTPEWPERTRNFLTPVKVAIQSVAEHDDLIFETKYWRVVLVARDQRFLGRAKIRSKIYCGDINCLKGEPWQELHTVIRVYQRAVRQAFGARVFNVGNLMNHAYWMPPYVPHVHWHVFPRYDGPVQFAGIMFRDPQFGEELSHDKRQDFAVGQELKRGIIAAIRAELPSTESK